MFIQTNNFRLKGSGAKHQKEKFNNTSKYTLQEVDHIEASTRDFKSLINSRPFIPNSTNKNLSPFIIERLQSTEMIIVCMNTRGVENFRLEILCLCNIMFQGSRSVSGCIQKRKQTWSWMWNSVPSAHYRGIFDILVV